MPDSAWRLARALFREAEAAGEAGLVQSDLESVAAALTDLEASRFLNHPLVALADKERVMETLARAGLTRRVLGLLVLDRELSLVPALLRHYVSVRRQAAGMAEAEVATPAPLSPAEETALREAVARLAGMRTLVDFKVSPELLGGVRLRLGTRVFDSTLRTRLAALEQRLSPV